jgi:hypothetical protein
MTTYVVTRKSDGQEVYRYEAESPVEWSNLPFSDFIHTALSDPSPAAAVDVKQWRIYVGPFFDRFGSLKLPILASSDAFVQAVVKDCTVRKYIALKEHYAELLAAINLLKSKGFAVDASAILDVQPQGEEVYRGE